MGLQWALAALCGGQGQETPSSRPLARGVNLKS